MKKIFAVLLLSFFGIQGLSAQYLAGLKGGYTIVDNDGFNMQLEVQRYLLPRIGLSANLLYTSYTGIEDDNQILYSTSAFYDLISLEKSRLAINTGLGITSIKSRDVNYYAPYVSLDYYYRLSEVSSFGASIGLSGGGRSFNFADIAYAYRFNEESTPRTDFESNAYFLIEGALQFGEMDSYGGFGLVLVWEFSDTFSAGLGSRFQNNGPTTVFPAFVDLRIDLIEGLVTPYTLMRFGYNFAEFDSYRTEFGQYGLGLKVDVSDQVLLVLEGLLVKEPTRVVNENMLGVISFGVGSRF